MKETSLPPLRGNSFGRREKEKESRSGMENSHPSSQTLILHPVILPVPREDQRLSGRPKVEALRRHARRAAVFSAQCGGWPLSAMQKDAAGVPLPSNGIHWSLSHKEAFVAAVVSPRPVGIDIEKIKPVRPGMFERLADAQEWALAPHRDLAVFFRYWTAKEAVLKAEGQGLTGLSRCRVVRIIDAAHLLLEYEQALWTVMHHRIDPGHLGAVTSDHACIVWHRPEG
ncbi:MAG: 4'-phosphopantetheinyl transferase superfamily protein [Desulfobacteraceae bacterium]|nr:MAG: 4'-phosphopantetheinyl transferase superfamily protein [Desulfobacteraceae bacterium]